MANKKKTIRRDSNSVSEVFKVLQEAVPSARLGLYGDMPKVEMDRISTGIVGLDLVLDGGIPKGRITELWADNGMGKTSLALSTIAECQKSGGTAAFLDLEHALDIEYAEKIGVDPSTLIFAQPETGEDAFEIIAGLAYTGEVDLIVVDSVAVMTPRDELEGIMGNVLPGSHARLMSQGLKKIISKCQVNNCAVIFINQTRSTLGMGGKKPTGGRSLGYYSSLRLDIVFHKDDKIKEGGEVEGHKRTVRVVKSKVSKPLVNYDVSIRYGEGLDRYQDILDLSVENGFVKKGGSWYTIEGEKMQGGGNARKYLKDNPDIYNTLREKVINGEWSDEGGVEVK